MMFRSRVEVTEAIMYTLMSLSSAPLLDGIEEATTVLAKWTSECHVAIITECPQ